MDDEQDTDDDINPTEYQLLPTGFGVNRVAVAGTVLSVEETNSEYNSLRMGVADQTGSIDVYVTPRFASDSAMRTAREVQPPAHVIIYGKAKTLERNDGETDFIVDPETMVEIDQETRNRWTAEAVEHTAERLQQYRDGDAPYGDTADEVYDFDRSELESDVATVRDELLEAVQ
jgi:RPA family protein